MIHLIPLTTVLIMISSLGAASDEPGNPILPLPAPLPYYAPVVVVPQEIIALDWLQYRASIANEPGDPVVPLPAPLPYYAPVVVVPQEIIALDWLQYRASIANEPGDPVVPLPAPLPFITSTIAIPHDIIGLDWRKYLGAASEEPGDPVVPLPAPLPFLAKVPPTPVGIWAWPGGHSSRVQEAATSRILPRELGHGREVRGYSSVDHHDEGSALAAHQGTHARHCEHLWWARSC